LSSIRQAPPLPQSSPRAARGSTSCSTRLYRKEHSPLLMWWISTCIGERSSVCSLMKIRNKKRTAGVRTLPGARSPGRSSRNGSGTSVSNWGMHSILRPCARQNLLPPRWVSLQRLHLIRSPGHLNQHPFPTGRHTGHAHRTRKGLPEQISLSSLMGHCAVHLGGLCMRKSGDQSAMARCEYCMQRGSAIVARVCSANNAKNRRRLSKRDG
jgi:hypothetical protein